MKYLSLSFAIVTLIIGMGLGYMLGPAYSVAQETEMTEGLGKPDKNLDKRYLDAMISHHRAAMLMSEQVKDKTQRSEIRNLAHDILNNEPKLIDELYVWKKDWYKDTTKVIDPQVPNFGEYDDKYDLRFLNAIIAHHLEGIDMAKEVMTKSSRQEVLNNADAVRTFLVTTLETFRGWRSQWYAIN